MNKQLFLMLVGIFLLSCSADKEEAVLSPLFKVCAALPQSGKYALNTAPVVDWDDGVLELDNARIVTYIGRHPDFHKGARLKKFPEGRRFVFMGQELEGHTQKILLAQRYSNEKNDFIYVMFIGENLDSSITELLLRKNFVYSCGDR